MKELHRLLVLQPDLAPPETHKGLRQILFGIGVAGALFLTFCGVPVR